MARITDALLAWAKNSWPEPDLTVADDGCRATLKFATENAESDFSYRAFFEVFEDRNELTLYLYAPLKVPQHRRMAVADVVARANFGGPFGRIDLDMDDGTIRFFAGIHSEDGQVSPTVFDQLQDMGGSALDRYLPAISAVTFAGARPEDAVATAEGRSAETTVHPTVADTNDVWPWSRIAGANLLQAWSRELLSACANKDDQEWRDTGRGVILVGSDMSRCREALRRVARESGMKFVAIASGDVINMPPIATFACLAPVLVYLEPGSWMLERQDDDSDEQVAAAEDCQRGLAEWFGAFDAARPVVLTTANYQLGAMAGTIDGSGRFDRYIVLPPLPLELVGTEFIDELGRDRCAESLTAAPGKLGKLLADQFPAGERRGLALLYLRRLHRREGRAIQFLDLMHLSTHGFGEEGRVESAPDDIRRQVAAHEAGHAAVAVLDSGGLNMPDYCSIVPGVDFKGVVAESVSYHQLLGDRITYADFRHQVRVSLAGRAAEELVVGPERVSSGAQGDLENCWRHASRAFAKWGFAPDMGSPGAASSNLSVVVGDPSPSELAHLEALVRRFLALEYGQVKELLAANRAFLDAIADRLMWDPIVDQVELSELVKAHVRFN